MDTSQPSFLPINASRKVQGGNVGWVLQQFERQLQACRRRHATQAKTLLIVVADADDFTVVERQSQLVGSPPVNRSDPLVVLIPRRHIETWIRAATGATVNETDDYKRPEPKKAEVRAAAAQIHAWAHGNPVPGQTLIPSLLSAISEWRKIG